MLSAGASVWVMRACGWAPVASVTHSGIRKVSIFNCHSFIPKDLFNPSWAPGAVLGAGDGGGQDRPSLGPPGTQGPRARDWQTCDGVIGAAAADQRRLLSQQWGGGSGSFLER